MDTINEEIELSNKKQKINLMPSVEYKFLGSSLTPQQNQDKSRPSSLNSTEIQQSQIENSKDQQSQNENSGSEYLEQKQKQIYTKYNTKSLNLIKKEKYHSRQFEKLSRSFRSNLSLNNLALNLSSPNRKKK